MGMPRTDYQKTQAAYAASYGCNIRTIKRYMKRGLPLDDPKEMAKFFGEQKNVPGVMRAFGINDEKVRKLKLEADRLELDLSIRRGEHTPNVKIREDVGRVVAAARGELMRLESDLPGVLVGLEEAAIQIKIREAVDTIMSRLADSASQIYAAPEIASS